MKLDLVVLSRAKENGRVKDLKQTCSVTSDTVGWLVDVLTAHLVYSECSLPSVTGLLRTWEAVGVSMATCVTVD